MGVPSIIGFGIDASDSIGTLYFVDELGIDTFKKMTKVQKEKTGNIFISENVSGYVPSTGAFSNQFIDGMKKFYELQSFLDVRLLRPGEDSFRVKEELLALTGTYRSFISLI